MFYLLSFFLARNLFFYSFSIAMNMLHLPRCELEDAHLLQEHGLIHAERTCQKCDKEMVVYTSKWRCRKCRGNISVRTGTYFESTRLPLLTIVWFMYAWAQELSSVKFCKRELKMCKEAVVDWSNFQDFFSFLEKVLDPTCEMLASMPSSTRSRKKLEVWG